MGTTEEWRSIHLGFYEVSSLGNVRRAKPGTSTFVGRPVLPQISAGGYAQVQLCGASSRKAYIHHLVAEAFIGERPKSFVVNHKDANKANNAFCNLEYISCADNCKHAVRTVERRKGPTKPQNPKVGLQSGNMHWTARNPGLIARGEKMPHSKLTQENVLVARKRISDGEKQCAVAKEMGISVAQMSRIIRGTRWTYL